MGKRFWTAQEDAYLKENFPHVYTDELCKYFNRTYASVCGHALFLGLKKSDAFKQMELQRQGDRLKVVGVKSRLKPGTTPPNKGKKQHEYMSDEAIERTKNTRFKKGQVPHNTKHDGAERTTKDGYTEVRIRQGKFRLKHLVMWEAVNGALPAGHCLWFIDQNKQNITLDNLELITRAENRIRNSGIRDISDKYAARMIAGKNGNPENLLHAKELLEVKRTQIKLNRKIKHYGKEQIK